jgi:surface-anchored protein
MGKSQLGLVLLSVALFAGNVAADSDLEWNPAVLTTEHVDLFTVQYNGSWNFFVSDDDNAIFHSPNAALNYVAAGAKTVQPAGSQWNFIGAGAGNDVWILPQSQNPDLLYAGARTIVNPGVFAGGIQVQLRSVEGPGDFSLYSSGSFGTPTVRSASADGINGSDAWSVPAPGHVHYNWAFTQAGIYAVEISASGNFNGGGSSNSYDANNPTRYYFAVDTPLQVASLDNNRLLSIDSSGDAVTVADASDGLLTPIAVTYDFRGNRYVADTLKNEIVKFDLSGNRTTLANLTDGVLFSTALTYRNDTEDLYVANYINDKILRIDGDGNTTVFADSAHGVDGAFGLAFDSTGNLFMSDIDNGRILKFDSLGNSTVFADRSNGIGSPMGLTFGDDGLLYVSDTLLSKIYRFESDGSYTVFADLGDGVIFPTGITFDPFGNLYVATYLNSTVLKFDPLGNGSVFANAVDGIGGAFGLDFFDINLPEPGGFALFSVETSAIPEASSLSLLGLSVAIAAGYLRRRRKLKSPAAT